MRVTMRSLPLLTLAALAVAGCSRGEAAEDGPSLQTAEVTRGDLTIRAEATGVVEPIREVEVKSKASGEVLRLHVDVGDEVLPGTMLADIDPRDVQNAFDQAEADLAVAKARSEISMTQLDRSTQLLEAGIITGQENENARLDFANSQAGLVKAQTNFELSELRLSDVRIRAPMAGTIIQKSVEEGAVIQSASGNVSGGTTLFRMANLGEMQVRTLVDETDMGEIRAGMTTTVKVEAFPDRTFRGTVLKIEPQATVEQNVTMFPVIVTLDNRGGLLKPGMNAEVEIMIDQALDVILVPNNAIVQTAEVGPAAMALGLDIEQIDLAPFATAGRGARGGQGGRGGNAGGLGGRGTSGDAQAGARSGAPSGAAAGAPTGGEPGAGQGDAGVRIQALRAQVESGEITQDSMRVLVQAMAGAGGFAGFGGDRPATDANGAPARQSRAAAVFVMNAGVPEPRLIRIGLNDWDRTQVVSGLEAGEVLAIVGAAQLQAQQAAFLQQMRDRMGGGSPFGGSARPPGGGRGR